MSNKPPWISLQDWHNATINDVAPGGLTSVSPSVEVVKGYILALSEAEQYQIYEFLYKIGHRKF